MNNKSNKRLTKEEFAKRANKVHENKYDYSLVEYQNIETKVKIICFIHGEFKQTPRSHLKGTGCIKCSGKYKPNLQEFIEKAKLVHGNLYDYSQVDYKNNSTKIKIICSKHGIFEQTPHDHITGYKCYFCGKESMADKQKLGKDTFIKKAEEIHNKRYDYSLVDYKNNKTKIKIVCKRHGIFKQTPSSHMNGNGCAACSTGGSVSILETKWLDYEKVPQQYRNKPIYINNDYKRPDAFDPENKIIWEFLGDYWHGNPNKYDSNKINKHNEKSFGKLYQETMDRIKLFEENGYKVIFIWESDFKKLLKKIKTNE